MIKITIFLAFLALVAAQTTLYPGYPYNGYTQFRSWSYFSLPLSESTINYVQLVGSVSSGTPFYYMNIDSYPTFQTNIWKYENVTGGNVVKYLYNPNIDINTGNYTNRVLYLGVYGYSNVKYTITVNTQGPITLYDRQSLLPSYPVPSTYVFYKFYVDYSLRALQVVSQLIPASNYYSILMSNSTTLYPVYNGKYQYYSVQNYYPGTGYTSCITINYPYPGTYRLGVSVNSANYTIQFVENGLGTCSTYSNIYSMYILYSLVFLKGIE